MNPYPTYKHSGIDWLGSIPAHWQVKRLKYVALVNPTAKTYSFDKNSEQEVIFLPMEKVSEDGTINQDTRKKISEVSSGFTYFERGDLIVAKITPCFENGKGAILSDLESDFGFGSTEFHTIRTYSPVDKRYLFFHTRSYYFMKLGEAFMTGSAGQKRVPSTFVEDYSIPLPPLPEQQAIAAFLDDKTQQIDALLTSKERMIELLKEERTAVINEAVTKGINSHVELKPSGVEWLGNVPKHWATKRLKFLVDYIKGLAFKTDFFQSEGIPVVKASDIKNLTIRKGKDFLNPEIACQFEKVKLKSGDIVISTVGSTPDVVNSAVGQIAIIPDEFSNSYLNQNTVKFISNDESILNNQFLFFVLISNPYRRYLDLYAHGTANQASLNIEDMLNFIIALPEIKEQTAIVQHIQAETGRIDGIIRKIEEEQALLEEYRRALISEVVTGKIRVAEA